jgi:hypothetical protein
VERR